MLYQLSYSRAEPFESNLKLLSLAATSGCYL